MHCNKNNNKIKLKKKTLQKVWGMYKQWQLSDGGTDKEKQRRKVINASKSAPAANEYCPKFKYWVKEGVSPS